MGKGGGGWEEPPNLHEPHIDWPLLASCKHCNIPWHSYKRSKYKSYVKSRSAMWKNTNRIQINHISQLVDVTNSPNLKMY